MPGKTSTPAKKAIPVATAKSGKTSTPATTNGKANGANGLTARPAKATVQPIAAAPIEVEVAQPVEIAEETVEDVADLVGEVDESSVFDMSTDELEDPRQAKPDAVLARIIEVSSFVSENKGSTAVKVAFFSDDLNKELRWLIFVPEQFVENIRVSPKSLPKEKGNNKAAQYSIGIHNRTKKASIDRLMTIAEEQGRDPKAGFDIPETFEDYVTNLNKLLGPQNDEFVRVVLLRRPNRDNGYLEIKDVLEPSLIEKKPSIFARYRRSWEVEEAAN